MLFYVRLFRICLILLLRPDKQRRGCFVALKKDYDSVYSDTACFTA